MRKKRKYSDERVTDWLVRNGIRFLEREFPGGAQKINVETVNVASAADCPFQQATGINIYDYLSQNAHKREWRAIIHGFTWAIRIPHEALTAAWQRGLTQIKASC